VLRVSKSGFYDWNKRKPSKRRLFNLKMLHEIKAIYEQSDKTYGRIRIHREIVSKGYNCNIKLVERLMRTAGIKSILKDEYKPGTTDSNHSERISPNILERDFYAEKPNEKWVSDITYIKVKNQWFYLCVIIDLFNREVIGWDLSESLETTSLLKAYQKAIQNNKPGKNCIFHSDRGVQYASKEFRNLLEKNQMIQSMSRKGDCWDNAVAESFFKTIKAEKINRVTFNNSKELYSVIFRYIEVFYNRKRLHSYLDFTNPVDYKIQYFKKVA